MQNFNPKTVTIGDVVWMAENLSYNDKNGGIYVNKETGDTYYTWDSAKRIADKFGWELPSVKDWDNVCFKCGCEPNETTMEYSNCNKLKSILGISLVGYYVPEDKQTFLSTGVIKFGESAVFWTGDDDKKDCACNCALYNEQDTISSYVDFKYKRFFSVRLIKRS